MMKLIGMPISNVGFKYNKPCEPGLCPEKAGGGNGMEAETGGEEGALADSDGKIKANGED
jgi:hypothetical protein